MNNQLESTFSYKCVSLFSKFIVYIPLFMFNYVCLFLKRLFYYNKDLNNNKRADLIIAIGETIGFFIPFFLIIVLYITLNDIRKKQRESNV